LILEYIVTGNEMKLLDDTTSQVFLVPSVVLMEQAAAGVVRELVACFDKSKEFAVICGRGNNAGDGIAIARLLNQAGYRCVLYYAFGTDEAGSELFELQKNIYARYGFKVVSDIEYVCKSDVIIDALFGTGLKRAIEGSLNACNSVSELFHVLPHTHSIREGIQALMSSWQVSRMQMRSYHSLHLRHSSCMPR
jgi:ADP-dependent NAD(P)H-hydrate dehydratase / NAD(P)H-hydrate epimerase